MKRSMICLSVMIAASALCVAQWHNTALPSGVNVNTLIARDSMLLAGTNGDGIFISTDNGDHWKSMNEGLQSKIVHALFTIGTTIFAGTETGASILTDTAAGWRSINSGLSGKSVWSFAGSNTTFVWDSTIYTSQLNPILCFAYRDGILFSGASDGVIAVSKWEPNFDRSRTWATGYLSSPYSAIYSMAMNRSYIFVATDSGVCGLWYPKTFFPPSKSSGVPGGDALEQNYPNPFNPMTTIAFSVPSTAFVSLRIFDLMGREVATLASEEMMPGWYSRVWNASSMPSGVYFYRLQAGPYTET